jgi:hypothetical protein
VRPFQFLVVLVAIAVASAAASPGGAAPPNEATGVFVVGDTTAAAAGPTDTITWWSHSWWQDNALSGGPAPAAFKGYAVEFSGGAPTCGGTWTTGPGNSPHPPDSVVGPIQVIIASSLTKSGNTISGNIVGFGTVTTDPGYGPNPGHPGTGTIIVKSCGE